MSVREEIEQRRSNILTHPKPEYRVGYVDALNMVLELLDGARSAWQPIATAPKDGTIVLGFDKPYTRVVWWATATRQWSTGSEYFQPTHWQPLPPPPSEAR